MIMMMIVIMTIILTIIIRCIYIGKPGQAAQAERHEVIWIQVYGCRYMDMYMHVYNYDVHVYVCVYTYICM